MILRGSQRCDWPMRVAISRPMRTAYLEMFCALICLLLAGCSNHPDAPTLSVTSVDGTIIELNDGAPMTVLFFFSLGNPVALGAFERLPDQLDDAVDVVGIAMHVDRPPNILSVQQKTLVPIVIDESSRIAEAFGGVDLTPTLILVERGSVLLRQRGQLDYDAVNAYVRRTAERES